MKSLIQILLLAIIVSCNNSEDKTPTAKETKSKTPTTSKTVKEKSKIDLEQNGDYSSLFYAGNCNNIVNSNTISEIVQTEVTSSGDDRFCRFTFQQDGHELFVTTMISDMSNYNIPKEVNNFMTNPPFLAHEISKTGDSHICRQDSHKRVMIYNTNYTNGIMISYGVNSVGKQFTKEQKSRLKGQAVDLANLLLINNQK